MDSNFDPQQFIDDVMAACKLQEAPADLREKLGDAILARLSDRIISTVTSWMSEEDVRKFEALVAENADGDPFDCLTEVAKNMPGMEKKLKKAIADLYEELTYDAERISDAAKLRQAMDRFQERKLN